MLGGYYAFLCDVKEGLWEEGGATVRGVGWLGGGSGTGRAGVDLTCDDRVSDSVSVGWDGGMSCGCLRMLARIGRMSFCLFFSSAADVGEVVVIVG